MFRTNRGISVKDIIALICGFLFLYENKAWATPRLVSFSGFQFFFPDDRRCALIWGRALRRFLYRVVYLGWLKGSSLQLTRTYERYAILLPFSNSSMSSPHFSFQSTRKNEAEIANWTPNYAIWTSIILLFSVVFFKSSPLARPRVVLVGGWWPPPSSSCVADGFLVCFSFVFRKVRGTKKPPATQATF